MSGIFVGAKEANLGFETGKAHSYLIYENDAGARFITSLTDVQHDLFPPRLRFDVEQINTPYDQAEESREPNRVQRPLDLGGRNADAVWILITEHAEAIKDEKPVYDPLTQNSNSFVASLLNVVGIDFDHNLPGFDGKQPTSNPHPSDYPGLHNLLNFDYHLVGTDLRDIIRGAGGDDHLWGKGDDDTLVGNKGADTLYGGPGIDTFAWTNGNHGGDTIADFTPATDRLQLDTVRRAVGPSMISMSCRRSRATALSISPFHRKQMSAAPTVGSLATSSKPLPDWWTLSIAPPIAIWRTNTLPPSACSLIGRAPNRPPYQPHVASSSQRLSRRDRSL